MQEELREVKHSLEQVARGHPVQVRGRDPDSARRRAHARQELAQQPKLLLRVTLKAIKPSTGAPQGVKEDAVGEGGRERRCDLGPSPQGGRAQLPSPGADVGTEAALARVVETDNAADAARVFLLRGTSVPPGRWVSLLRRTRFGVRRNRFGTRRRSSTPLLRTWCHGYAAPGDPAAPVRGRGGRIARLTLATLAWRGGSGWRRGTWLLGQALAHRGGTGGARRTARRGGAGAAAVAGRRRC